MTGSSTEGTSFEEHPLTFSWLRGTVLHSRVLNQQEVEDPDNM